MDLRPGTTGIIMADGSALTLTLNFMALYRLKNLRPKVYKQLNTILLHGTEDVLDYVTMIYGGYLCANVASMEGGAVDNLLTWEQFLAIAPEINEVAAAAKALMNPKKSAASATPSATPPDAADAAE